MRRVEAPPLVLEDLTSTAIYINLVHSLFVAADMDGSGAIEEDEQSWLATTAMDLLRISVRTRALTPPSPSDNPRAARVVDLIMKGTLKVRRGMRLLQRMADDGDDLGVSTDGRRRFRLGQFRPLDLQDFLVISSQTFRRGGEMAGIVDSDLDEDE